MVLKDSVFYREYNEYTFICDTQLNLAHTVPAPVALFFDLFKDDITESEAAERLKKSYPEVSVDVIKKDVHDFAEFLISKGMIENTISLNAPNSNALPKNSFFHEYTFENELLYSAMLEITYSCPERCKHCCQSYMRTEKDYCQKELSFEEIKALLDELFELNVLELVITGGEPFARRDCFDILEYAKEKGFATTVFSNGILLSEDDIKRISDLKLKCFSTSLYSHIPQKHDEITGIAGSYEKTMNVLNALSEYGICTEIKFVLMEENKNDFSGVADIAKKTGSALQLIPGLNPSCFGDWRIDKINIKDDMALKKAVADYMDFSGYHPNYEKTDFSKTCEAGRNSLSIDPYGDVKPCISLPYILGNVRSDTVESIWQKKQKT